MIPSKQILRLETGAVSSGVALFRSSRIKAVESSDPEAGTNVLRHHLLRNGGRPMSLLIRIYQIPSTRMA